MREQSRFLSLLISPREIQNGQFQNSQSPSQSVADIQLHTREVAGEYTGTDATMIKMELSEVSIKRTKKQRRNIRHTSPQTSLLEGNRKVSRM